MFLCGTISKYSVLILNYLITLQLSRPSLELPRLHIKMDLSIFSQARRGVCELPVIRGRGLGMSGHFRISTITRTGVQATAAVMQII